MAFLRRFYDNFEEWVSASLVGLMILCLIIQVFIRFVFGSALAWTEELSRYSFIWAVYVGAALCVKRRIHVRITAQFLKLDTRGRLFFLTICDAIWVAFNIFIVINSVEVILDGLDFPEMSPTLGIVKSWVEAIIPFSFALMSWRLIEQYYVHWKAGTMNELVKFEEMV
ncbi:MAG: TRAP transporter small permease [Desulfovibrio sp.]|nr:TRAP transporter small permease [Desulfovibrio sp.]